MVLQPVHQPVHPVPVVRSCAYGADDSDDENDDDDDDNNNNNCAVAPLITTAVIVLRDFSNVYSLLFNREMRSSSTTLWSPNETPLQPLNFA